MANGFAHLGDQFLEEHACQIRFPVRRTSRFRLPSCDSGTSLASPHDENDNEIDLPDRRRRHRRERSLEPFWRAHSTKACQSQGSATAAATRAVRCTAGDAVTVATTEAARAAPMAAGRRAEGQPTLSSCCTRSTERYRVLDTGAAGCFAAATTDDDSDDDADASNVPRMASRGLPSSVRATPKSERASARDSAVTAAAAATAAATTATAVFVVAVLVDEKDLRGRRKLRKLQKSAERRAHVGGGHGGKGEEA